MNYASPSLCSDDAPPSTRTANSLNYHCHDYGENVAAAAAAVAAAAAAAVVGDAAAAVPRDIYAMKTLTVASGAVDTVEQPAPKLVASTNIDK